mgnify:CR=1 FL=1
MGKLIVLKINNSRKAAIIKGKWKDPGAKLYDQLLDAMYCKGDIPTNPKDLEAAIKSGDYCDWPGFLKEAYAVAPVKDIKNSPYGRTPFSRSGCKYPHHVIKNGQLVVSIPGLRSAYICARNQGVLVNHTPENKQIVAHLNKHFRELSIEPVWHHGELYFQDTKTKKFTERFDFDGVDTVIFDIGSVLSEPKGGKELIKKKYHNKFNETQLDCFVKSYYDKLEDYETASIFNAKKLYQSFLTDDIKQYSDDIFEILALSGDAYDYTDSMIKELKNKGYKLYYLSNWHKSGFELMKQKGKFKYLDQFDGGLVSYDAGCQKPDPKIYQLLIDRFKLNPHTCIFFDDREENIEAAKKIGFKAEQFHRDTVKEINTMKRDNVYNERIAENFHFIQQHIFESMRINLFDESDYFKVLKSNVDENFKPKGTKSLSDFTMMKITKELTKKFADQGKLISYMRDDDPKYDDECLLWVDDQGNYVCSITYDKVPNKDDGHKWISGMDVAYAYNGYGLSHQLLDYAIDHGVDALSVQMDNEIALKTYKSHGFEISQESQSKVDNGLSSQYDMFLSANQSPNESFNESVMSNEAIVLNSSTLNEIGHTPEEIYEWMHKNISYDKTITGWKLKLPSEVYVEKKGNCHDQALFEAFIFHSLGIINGQIFFVEFSKDNPIGGNSHTLTWFRTATKEAKLSADWKAPFNEENAAKGPFKFWWFENAWEDQSGIHGPYDSVNEIKDAVLEVYNNDNDINSHKYDGIVFATNSNYRCGMSLGEYVESWRLDDDRIFDKGKAIKEGFEWIEDFINNEEFRKTFESNAQLNMETQSWRTEILCEHVIPQGKIFMEADSDVPPELDTDEEKDVLDEDIDSPPELDNNVGEEQSEDNNIESEEEKNAGTDTSSDNDQDNEVNNETPNEKVKEEKPEPKKESLPKQADRAESDKNGVRRKKLYIAFIEWSKEYNSRNTFGSIFDKDAFHDSYPFIPHEMRYFYRLANPMLCVLAGDLTFFQVAELRKLNANNKHLDEMLIFAATPKDLRVFNIKDKKVYRAEDSNGEIQLKEVLSDTFDTYIQMMIQKGDILNGPIEDESKKDE